MKKLILALCLFSSFGVYAQDVLSPELLWKLGRVSDVKVSPDGKSILYNVRTFDVQANSGNSDIYKMDIDGKNAIKIAGEKENENTARWRSDGKKIAFLSDKDGDSQVWEMSPDGSEKTKLTSVEGGVGSFGYSPALNFFWYSTDVKLDQTTAELYPDLPKASGRIFDNLMYRHWTSWHDNAYSHVFLSAYSNGQLTGKPMDLMKGEKFDAPMNPFGGDEQIAFSKDGKKLAYTCKKLHGTAYAISTNSDIYVYDITSATTKNVSQGMMGYDMNPVFSPDGNKMVWMSMEQAGYEADRNRIMLYDFESNTSKELLNKFDYSVDHVEFSSDGKSLYFSAGVSGVDQIFVYDFNPKAKTALRQITNHLMNVNEFDLSEVKGKTSLVASLMSISKPSEIYLIDVASGATAQISEVNKDVLSKVKMGNVEKRMIKTSDGKDMLTWIIYPPNFDPKKKYPTLLYCQGGPQSTVSQFFSYRWNFQLMAANGYIIVAPNRRGLPSFGEEWNDKITGDWGGQAFLDYLSAIDQVSAETFVDKDKMGAIGASYGGYSVYWLAGHHNKRFKTFISHCGVFNLESEFGSTEEMWFPMHDFEGPYWANPRPKSYEKFSPHNFVQNWDTPILVIHNEKDFRVPLTQGMEAFTAAQMKNIPSRFLYFPDEGHWVNKPQNSILWQRVFFDWLDRSLK